MQSFKQQGSFVLSSIIGILCVAFKEAKHGESS